MLPMLMMEVSASADLKITTTEQPNQLHIRSDQTFALFDDNFILEGLMPEQTAADIEMVCGEEVAKFLSECHMLEPEY